MSTRLQLHNRTLTVARCVGGIDHRGADVIVLVVKRTYEVSPRGRVRLASPPSPIRMHPVMVSDAPNASLKYPHDVAPEKPGTDVLLVGTAHPPRGSKKWNASVTVQARHGIVSKTVDIYGPRVWTLGATTIAPGPPAEAQPTPLIYELSYGGCDDSDPETWEERNPAGTGFPRRASLVDQLAPAIEDPRAPLTSSSPAPAGFGPIHAHWLPRSGFAGTLDEAWRASRAPMPPDDFDPRHHQCAPSELWSEQPLVGDEPIAVLGVKPEGDWRFQLPAWRPLLLVAQGGSTSDHLPHLDTLLIDADESRVELVWRLKLDLAPHLEAIYIFDHGEEDLDALTGHLL